MLSLSTTRPCAAALATTSRAPLAAPRLRAAAAPCRRVRAATSPEDNGAAATKTPPPAPSSPAAAAPPAAGAEAPAPASPSPLILLKGQGTAIVTGAASILFGIAYLALAQFMSSRGGELLPPPPEAFGP